MSQIRLPLPGESAVMSREYPNDPGPRKWNRRAQALRERRFARVPQFTARRYGLHEQKGPRIDPVIGLSGPRGER